MVRYILLILFVGLPFAQDITIAVLDFDGNGVSQSETRTLTNRLRDELFKTGVYIVLERGKMDDVLKEQGFQQTGCVTSECAVEVGNMLGVQQMVGGSIGKVGNIYTISARIIDVVTGEVLKSAKYDNVNNIETLLTQGMQEIALKLVGNEFELKKTQKKDIRSATMGAVGEAGSHIRFDPESGKTVYPSNKYISVYMGYGPGSLENFYAESAFSSPENPSERLWTANVLDVSTENSLPQLGLKLGGWKGWFGGELEMSLFRHKTPAQIVYYDSHGQVFIPPTPDYPDGYYYTIEPQDSVALPDNFLNFNSFSIGGVAYLNMPFIKNINPTIGFGLSFAMNNVNSDYPGPGSFAAKNVMAAFGYDIKDSQSLNTTDFGWGFDIPIGLKYRANDNIFFSIDFRLSTKYIYFVGSDAYLKEKDETVLQSFQINLGVGKFIN